MHIRSYLGLTYKDVLAMVFVDKVSPGNWSQMKVAENTNPPKLPQRVLFLRRRLKDNAASHEGIGAADYLHNQVVERIVQRLASRGWLCGRWHRPFGR